MKVLKATQEQYNELNGYEYNQSILIFVKDGNNNWVCGLNNLNNPDFSDIKPNLEILEQITWLPPAVPND